MSPEEFLSDVFFPNMYLYFICLAVALGVLYPLFKYRARCLIDPMVFNLFTAGTANAVVIFLYATRQITFEKFAYMELVQLVFWIAFYISSRKIFKIKRRITRRKWGGFDSFFFKICFTVFFLTQIIYFVINGIPIFNDNRFAQNIDNSSGILGLLTRASSCVNMMLLIYVIHLLLYKRSKKGYIASWLIILFSLLSGSKSFILSFVFAFFYYSVYYNRKIPRLKKKYAVLIALTPLIVILLSGMATDGLGSIVFLLYRFMANGDMYWYALPNDVIDNANFNCDGIVNITYFLWGPFRHVLGFEVDSLTMQTVGSLVFALVRGSLPDGGAPNSPFSITLWVFYRWFSLIVVIPLAYLHSFLCYKFQNRRVTLVNTCIIALSMTCGLCFQDIYLFFANIFSLMLFVIVYKISKYAYGMIVFIKNRQ